MILKSKWRVSMAAIVKRAYDLGVIPKSKYSSLFREINYRGMRFEEPIDLAEEKPSLFSRILEMYRSQLGYSINELCRLLNILPKHFMKATI
jgi:Zn-dependent peptidase ImmA (M78 family)